MPQTRYLTAREAAAALGVKETTLYAYVSRGLIRSEAVSDTPRQHLYLAEDVQKLVQRKAQRRDPAKAARDALHWGTPMLDSDLTLITEQTLYYRGYDAACLARERSLEEVAALLWTGEMDHAAALLTTRPLLTGVAQTVIGMRLPPMQSLQMVLTLAAAEDLSAYDLRPAAVLHTGVRILWLLTAVAAQRETLAPTIAGTLAQAWHPNGEALLNTALILCADHELNTSSFAARVVASADATPYAAVMAGLAALSGFKHGGATERAVAFLRDVGEASRVQLVLAERLRRGEGIPGFGNPLYPERDPRAAALLTLLGETYPDAAEIALAHAVIRAAATVTGSVPTIDFALAVLAQTLHLPAGAGLTLFALGRTVGWIGHALEQYQSRQLIRPRARYTGVPPRFEALSAGMPRGQGALLPQP